MAQDPDAPAIPLDKVLASGVPRLFERSDDWCACAYFYLDSPAGQPAPLPPANERSGGLPASDGAVYRAD